MKLYLIVWALFYSVPCQSLTSIKLQTPDDCSNTEQFDANILNCKQCPDHSSTSANDKFNCRCDEEYYFLVNNGASSIECSPCPSNQIQSSNGFSCISKSSNVNCENGYFQDYGPNGNKYASRICVKCDLKSSILLSNKCQTCRRLIAFDSNDESRLNELDCTKFYLDGGLLFFNDSISGQPNYYKVNFDRKEFDSYILNEYARSTYRTCKQESERNVTACQCLANLCVLNLYDKISGLNQIDVCEALEDLNLNQNAQNTLPILSYEQTYGSYKALYKANGIESEYLTLDLANSNPNSLEFYAAEYDLSGNLVNYDRFDIRRLQLCSLFSSVGFSESPFKATSVKQSCSIELESLFSISDSRPLRFYDFYIKYGNNKSNLIPVPVKVLNFKSGGVEINRNQNENEHIIHRRFFLYESSSSKAKLNESSLFIRFAKSIRLNFELVEEKSRGEIYPPVLVVDYGYAKRTDNKNVQVEFAIEYKMNLSVFIVVFYICLAVFCFAAFLWTLMRTWSWSRRSGRYTLDLITMFKFFMFLFASLSNALLLAVALGSLYWLIFYKWQQYAYLVPPVSEQENIFGIFLCVAFSLKLVDILHLILTQTSFDMFIIEWEKPKTSIANNKKDDFSCNEMSRLSCWRTLFVCNEWNELQAHRKTSLTFQLITVLFLLKVIGLEQFSTRDLTANYSRSNDSRNSYHWSTFSAVLRMAVASSIYLSVGFIQWLFYGLFYSRCVRDKLGEFVDFCTLSNISMFIMTHAQYGYYIHGRSPHGSADQSLNKIVQALQRESVDLTSKRGLEPDSNQQSFSISVPSKLTQQYGKVMNPIFQMRNSENVTKFRSNFEMNQFEKRMNAFSQLNRFLMSFIENSLRNINYTILNRNFIESLLDIEFKEPVLNAYFYKDDLNCFGEAIFFGQEKKLFAFDLLLFLLVDYFSCNFILSACVEYFVEKVLKRLRSDLGARNLSRKTLVDKRFLI